jgi:hypothetical protein
MSVSWAGRRLGRRDMAVRRLERIRVGMERGKETFFSTTYKQKGRGRTDVLLGCARNYYSKPRCRNGFDTTIIG